jgi:hypothetical protein
MSKIWKRREKKNKELSLTKHKKLRDITCVRMIDPTSRKDRGFIFEEKRQSQRGVYLFCAYF